MIPTVNLLNGILEIELSVEPATEADPQMRGFVGIAFRVVPDNYSIYECIYLRPTATRAENEIQMNNSTQYVSQPEYPWYIIREIFSAVYESYATMISGKWTKYIIKIKNQQNYIPNND